MIPLPPPPPPPPPPPAPPGAPKKRGRPVGSRNVQTLLREAALKAAMDGVTPDGPASADALTLLRSVYKNPAVNLEMRLKAAALAAPLEVARPVPVPPPKENVPLAQSLDAAFKRTGRARLVTPEQRTLSAADEASLAEMLGLST